MWYHRVKTLCSMNFPTIVPLSYRNVARDRACIVACGYDWGRYRRKKMHVNWDVFDLFSDECLVGASWIVSQVSLAAFLLIPLPEQISAMTSLFLSARALFWETMRKSATPKVASYDPQLLVRRSTTRLTRNERIVASVIRDVGLLKRNRREPLHSVSCCTRFSACCSSSY